MKKFIATYASYSDWKKHPFTQVLLAIIDQKRRDDGLIFTTDIELGKDPDIIIQSLAKLKGMQEVWEMFVTENILKEQLLNDYIQWDDEIDN